MKHLKLFIVSTTDYDYDDYDSHVIAARNHKEARKLALLPGNSSEWKVKIIGTASCKIPKILHSSFHAG